ncbi:MAG: phenylalanine--tRNA ligase subunit beta, partial [Candidatus Woesearchaeota archaeon]
MPTIKFSMTDLSGLVGKKLSEEALAKLLESVKGELEGISGDEVTVKLNDTNLPYLWSVEGLARAFRGLLGLSKGLQRLKVTKTRLKLIVESSVKHVRGHISAFVAKGKKIDQYLLGQLIQFQEKLSEVFGRKRQKLAIGLYPCKKILFPIRYKAVAPNTVKFVPLGMRAELSLSEILQKHSKGREYGWILEGQKKVPILVDSKRDVLSFPPIINSELTGRLGPGDSELFFEATGTDAATVSCAANIFAHALADRGFSIEAVTVMSGGKTFQSPD